MDKKCTGCNQKKTLDQFSSRGNGKYHSRCKQCQREYCKDHYQRNRDLHIHRAKTRKQVARSEQLENISSIKNDSPCMDCGEQYPFYVMDFDHVRGEKELNISRALRRTGDWSIDRILAEIRKCEVRCSNCHRIATYRRRIKTQAQGPQS